MGAWELLQDLTVQSNTQSVVMNNFGTITKDDFYKIVFNIEMNAGNFINITANSSVSTNYHTQELQADGNAAPGGARANNSQIGITSLDPADDDNVVIGYLKLSENDRLNIFTNQFVRLDSAVRTLFRYISSSGATFASGITSLTFTGDAASGIKAGSRIQIYKLAATKVADITVGTNSTQVNIPFPIGTLDPAIDKDSEYLLVSDITPTSATNIVLGVNDVTATNQYYYQAVGAFGSSTYAVRENQGLMIYLPTGQKGLVHSHIKLSNIGVFTGQHYGFQDYGTAAPTILNRFQTSISENITSITKLNILAQTTNAIQAGSRFILYRLY